MRGGCHPPVAPRVAAVASGGSTGCGERSHSPAWIRGWTADAPQRSGLGHHGTYCSGRDLRPWVAPDTRLFRWRSRMAASASLLCEQRL